MDDLDLDGVTEPHDFGDEKLVALDSALRCSICKDLVNSPVFAPCSHSFCSMCIRESLSIKAECPVCRAATSDGLLKRNTMLSEVVEAYKLARSLLLSNELAAAQQSNYPGSVLGKRKRSDTSMRSNSPESWDVTPKVPRIDSNGSAASMSSASRAGPSRTISNDNEFQSPTKGRSKPNERNSMVSCPICDEFIDEQYINQHLDRGCQLSAVEIESLKAAKRGVGRSVSDPQTNGKAQAKAWASVLGPQANMSSKLKTKANDVPVKRISKVNYDIKSARQLRELLSECGLSDKGDVPALKARHERWVNLWNAEVDAPKARSRGRHALLREMAEWENTLTRTKNKAAQAPKVDSSKDWLEDNRGQFDRLVMEARTKMRKEAQDSDVLREDSERENSEEPGPVEVIELSPSPSKQQ